MCLLVAGIIVIPRCSGGFVRANLEALSAGESTVCTGPKKENIYGHIICRCENTAPCQDMYGCD